MRVIFTLFLHAIVTIIRLARPGGLRSVVAESRMVKKVELVEKIRGSDRMISSHSLKAQEPVQSSATIQVQGGSGMIWARVLAYVTGTVNQELLLRNEY